MLTERRMNSISSDNMKSHTRMKFYCFTIFWLFCSLCSAESASTAKEGESLCDVAGDKNTLISEQGYVRIGGIEQWVTVRGTRCSNPVILFVHGGPGNPMSLYSESLYRGWENEFTLVHWDQRGSGKTYEANQEPGELTVERLNKTELTIDLIVKDGLEVTDYVRKRLGKEKLVITGTSWGSVVAVRMVHERPESYLFYMGLSQIVNYHENVKKSYEAVLSRARVRADRAALDVLNEIGPPSWVNPKSFGKLRRIIRGYESEFSEDMPELRISGAYESDRSRAAYESGEEFSFVKFVGLRGDGMAQGIALDQSHTEFEIPVFLIQGTEDLLTVPEVTESYFEKIKAPEKSYVKIERCGHDPNLRMLNKQLDMLRNHTIGMNGSRNAIPVWAGNP